MVSAKTPIEGKGFEGPVVNKSHCSDKAACSDLVLGVQGSWMRKVSIERTRSERECE